MFIIFSPYSFIFFSTYLFFLLSLLRVNNFYYFWVIIEIIILLFIGLSYTLFIRSYSQLMIYFLIQALSSFLVLIFYVYNLPLLLTFAFLMKLSIFPFFMWYINLMYRFPNFIFWLARTLHKVPAIQIIIAFSLPLDLNVLWVSILLTTLIRGVIMLSVIDFRIVLVLSSIGNNSWFLLRQITNIFCFYFFVGIYSLSIFYLLLNFNGLSKPVLSSRINPSSYSLSFWVLSLSGIPPFPVFYSKILVIIRLLRTVEFNYLFFVFLIFNALIVIGYLQAIIKYFIYVYSSKSHYFLKY